MYHPEPDLTLDAAAREAVIAGLLERLEARYVFPDVAAQMAAAIHAHQDAGDYADITSAAAFCERLTADMQAVSHDKHLHIWHSATPLPPRVAQEDDPAWQAGARRQ